MANAAAWDAAAGNGVYGELRRVAQALLRGERHDHTLQATALVHEAVLRLYPSMDATWEDRSRLLGIAARVMRQVLVDHARSRHRDKRGGPSLQRMPLEETSAVLDPASWEHWEDLDRALDRLAELDPRQCQVVELRYFGGLTVEETARVLGISEKTVKRDWSMARAWLRRELAPQMAASAAV